MPRVLMVIAPQVFRDEEYAVPKEVLESHGATVVTASSRTGTCHGKLGMTAEATVSLDGVDPVAYDAIVFVGGGGAEIFFDDPLAHEIAREAVALDRVVAAICIAPSVLARAGVLRGVQATAFESQKDDVRTHGAVWSRLPVVVDGRIITANGPDAAHDFGAAIAAALGLL
jgi:protease I